MRMPEWIKKLASFIGIVLDVRDIAGLIRNAFGAVGGSVIVVAVANWIWDNLPPLTLILLGVGAFCILLASLPNIFRLWRKTRATSQGESSWLFDILAHDLDRIAMSIRGKVTRWDFSSLKSSEPHLEFFIELVNTTVFTFNLKGVKGFARIAGERCQLPPQTPPRYGIDRTSPVDIRIYQPVTPETAAKIQSACLNNAEVQFDLREVEFEFETTTKGYEKHKPNLRGGEYKIIPKEGLIDLDSGITIDVHRCTLVADGQNFLMDIWFTVKIPNPPATLVTIQLCIGKHEIDPIEPKTPILLNDYKESFVGKYKTSHSTVLSGRQGEPGKQRDLARICIFARGQKWLSEEFSIPQDSNLTDE